MRKPLPQITSTIEVYSSPGTIEVYSSPGTIEVYSSPVAYTQGHACTWNGMHVPRACMYLKWRDRWRQNYALIVTVHHDHRSLHVCVCVRVRMYAWGSHIQCIMHDSEYNIYNMNKTQCRLHYAAYTCARDSSYTFTYTYSYTYMQMNSHKYIHTYPCPYIDK